MSTSLLHFDPIADDWGLHRLDFDLDENSVVGSREETFWNRKTTLADLIAKQGPRPITNIDDLRAGFWPEHESVDEFIDTVRRWRSEGE
jgi:hypothetical protein